VWEFSLERHRVLAIDVGLLIMIMLDHVGAFLVVAHLHVWVVALPFPSHPFMGVEFASFSSDPFEGMQVSGLMKILLPLLWYPTFCLQLCSGLPSFQYPVILFGIDIKRFLLQHFRPGEWNSLLYVGWGARSCATVGNHHDDILTILASSWQLDHLVALALAGLLDVHLLWLSLVLNLDWLINQGLSICRLDYLRLALSCCCLLLLKYNVLSSLTPDATKHIDRCAGGICRWWRRWRDLKLWHVWASL